MKTRCFPRLRLVCAVLGCLFAASGLSAQEAAPTIEFTVFGEIGREWDGLYYSPDGRRYEEVRFARYSRSAPQSYRGESPFRVYRRSLDRDGEWVYTPVAETTLPAGASPVLLFFFSQPGGPEGAFRILPMDDSEVALPVDHVVFFNATGVQLLGRFGDEELTLNPGQSRPLALNARFREEVPVGFVVRRGDTFERVLVNRLRFSEGLRTVILLLPPRRADSFRIQALRIVEQPGRTTPDPPPPRGRP
ncbi:MAG: hypothetical protein JJT96_12425 [Opitutales bacterium]|nr:hypothetical protein [Opitutales bacterium]